jgi:hypothetical protein
MRSKKRTWKRKTNFSPGEWKRKEEVLPWPLVIS